MNPSIDIREMFRELVRTAAKDISKIIENFNIPIHALHVPIVSDYVAYNKEPHQGEVINARL